MSPLLGDFAGASVAIRRSNRGLLFGRVVALGQTAAPGAGTPRQKVAAAEVIILQLRIRTTASGRKARGGTCGGGGTETFGGEIFREIVLLLDTLGAVTDRAF